MKEDSGAPSNEASLHEYTDADFAVAGLESPSREKELHEALEGLSGVKSIIIRQGKVTVHYEPVFTSEKKIEEAMRAAGFHISEAHVAPASSLTNAFADKQESQKTG